MRAIIDYETEVPVHWDKEMIEFKYNEGYRGVIYGLCVKDNYFYKFKTYPRYLPYDCDGFNCEDVAIEKDLIKLLEDEQD